MTMNDLIDVDDVKNLPKAWRASNLSPDLEPYQPSAAHES